MTEIIVYGCLCNLENLPRSGDLSFITAKDLLYLTTMLSGSLDAGIPFSFFFQKRKQIGTSLDHERPIMEQSGLTLSIPLPRHGQRPARPSSPASDIPKAAQAPAPRSSSVQVWSFYTWSQIS